MSTFAFLAFFTIVVGLPVVGGIGSKMFTRWLEHKEAMRIALDDRTAERAAQYAAKTERLEQRVAVLERILTDRSTALGEEIDRLRSQPIN